MNWKRAPLALNCAAITIEPTSVTSEAPSAMRFASSLPVARQREHTDDADERDERRGR